MRRIRPTSADERVFDEFKATYPGQFAIIDRESDRVWTWWELSTLETLQGVILSHHSHGRVDLVPKDRSLTVNETVSQLLTIYDQYKKESQDCHKRLESLRVERMTPVILTTRWHRALAPGPEPRREPRVAPLLFHVDGLHRLVAWGIGRPRGCPRYIDARVRACIAGLE